MVGLCGLSPAARVPAAGTQPVSPTTRTAQVTSYLSVPRVLRGVWGPHKDKIQLTCAEDRLLGFAVETKERQV